MTAPHDPDDLASALLDGLLTADQAAAARRDPAVVARLAELAAVRESVRRSPARPDPVARERGLAAALAAFDVGDDDAEQRGAGASVVGPVGDRGRRGRAERPAGEPTGIPWRPPGRAGRRWLAAAAVVLAVVGLGVVVSNWDAGSDSADTAGRETSTRAGDDAGGGSDEATAEEAEDGAAEQGAAPTVAPGGIVDLGELDSPEALVESAQSVLAAESARPLGPASSGQDAAHDLGAGGGALRSRCPDFAGAPRLPATGETIVLEARATLHGDSVDVWVLAADGKQRVVAVDATCEVVVDRPLD
jgi:hypothetical protein